MPALAELQKTFLGGLLGGADDKAKALIASNPIGPEAALQIHRNTIFRALANALRLTFPTVERLVGAEFFDQTVMWFATQSPPHCVDLSAFGESFPDFLAAYPPAMSLPYLRDVARFDLAIDRAAASTDEWSKGEEVSAGQVVQWKESLRLELFHSPVDLIRDAFDGSDSDRLSDIPMTSDPRWFAFWRGARGACALQVSPAFAEMLSRLLSLSAPPATDDWPGSAPPLENAGLNPEEVLRAPFLRIVRRSGGER